jgi:hypothetical protein
MKLGVGWKIHMMVIKELTCHVCFNLKMEEVLKPDKMENKV